MKKSELKKLNKAKKVIPKYKQNSCGCGEGCEKLTDLINNGEHYCIFHFKGIL